MFVISVLAGIKYLMLAAPLAAFLFAMKILRNKVFVLWIINTTSNGTEFGPAASSWQVDSGFTTGFSSLPTVRFAIAMQRRLSHLHSNETWPGNETNMSANCQRLVRNYRYIIKGFPNEI